MKFNSRFISRPSSTSGLRSRSRRRSTSRSTDLFRVLKKKGGWSLREMKVDGERVTEYAVFKREQGRIQFSSGCYEKEGEGETRRRDSIAFYYLQDRAHGI
jgi:hypothetical protein